MKNILVTILLLIIQPVFASDHIDGVPTIADGQADLTDLYAFPTPQKVNSLTVIFNMYPGVKPDGHFSSKVNYEIGLRRLDKKQSPQGLGFAVQQIDALDVRCQFTDPGHHHGSKEISNATCDLFIENEKKSSLTGPVNETLENESFKLFTGPRADAFFLSLAAFDGVTKRKGFETKEAGTVSNLMDKLNALTITVEINLENLGLDHGLWAISGQSLEAKTGAYIDRVGRAEITNFSLHNFDGKPIKRSYNQKYHFAVSDEAKVPFQERLLENISAYDLLDGAQDWAQEDLKAFTDVLLDDFLVVDMQGVCDLQSQQFLDLEQALLLGLETTSCGGRRPGDDIMATLTAYYLGGLFANLNDYGSGVVEAYQGNPSNTLSNEFPYLANPGKTPLWKQKLLWIQKKLAE